MTWYSEFIKRIRRRKIRMVVLPVETRHPHTIGEKNSSKGTGTLSDDEVARFYAAVTFLQSAIPQGLGKEWSHQPYSGDGYVLTERIDRPTLMGFVGYGGIRKADHGYDLVNCDERGYEQPETKCARFADALKAYAADAVSESRTRSDSLAPDPVSWNVGWHRRA